MRVPLSAFIQALLFIKLLGSSSQSVVSFHFGCLASAGLLPLPPTPVLAFSYVSFHQHVVKSKQLWRTPVLCAVRWHMLLNMQHQVMSLQLLSRLRTLCGDCTPQVYDIQSFSVFGDAFTFSKFVW